jgi:hypothetical protein
VVITVYCPRPFALAVIAPTCTEHVLCDLALMVCQTGLKTAARWPMSCRWFCRCSCRLMQDVTVSAGRTYNDTVSTPYVLHVLRTQLTVTPSHRQASNPFVQIWASSFLHTQASCGRWQNQGCRICGRHGLKWWLLILEERSSVSRATAMGECNSLSI